ncbi:ABC transporter permease [Pseudomonas paeninsulae]|nr:ABC transporter permease [Pseudomonas sp. IT1137]
MCKILMAVPLRLSGLIGLCAGIVPARRAARLHPLDALRRE